MPALSSQRLLGRGRHNGRRGGDGVFRLLYSRNDLRAEPSRDRNQRGRSCILPGCSRPGLSHQPQCGAHHSALRGDDADVRHEDSQCGRHGELVCVRSQARGRVGDCDVLDVYS